MVRYLPFSVLPSLLLLTAWLLWPGTRGTFLLDDIPNLGYLTNMAAGTWSEQLSLAFHQVSGSTRFLPALSFGLQAHAWPSDPGVMIQTNIALHLCNGVLVYWLAHRLLMDRPRHTTVALIGAAIWLVSPIQVSGVLYIVQRINQMSAFFALAGLVAYVQGRRFVADAPRSGIAWMSFGIALGGGLAVLSKENGVLVPLLALVCEATLLRHVPWPRWGRAWRIGMLYAPLLIAVGILGWGFESYVLEGYAKRNFSIGERLLSEGRIVLDYLRVIVMPRPHGLGVFHDDELVARGSASDFALAAAAAALLVAGWLFRRRWPVPAFGVLWFFAGHALESTVIPLELYFEHRNYLPAFGPALALASIWESGVRRAQGPVRAAVIALGLVWLGVTAGVAAQQAALWGNPPALGAVAEEEHPGSHRAALFQANLLLAQGFADAAVRRFQRAAAVPANRLEWLRAGCGGNLPTLPDISTLATDLEHGRRDVNAIGGLARLADALEEQACATVDPSALNRVVQALRRNPVYAEGLFKLDVLEGRFMLVEGRYEAAATRFADAARRGGGIEARFLEIKALHAQGDIGRAGLALEALAQTVETGGMRTRRYRADIERWRGYLAASVGGR